jgi:uncharacterized metal-binding protein
VYFVGVLLLLTACLLALLNILVPVDPTGVLRQIARATWQWGNQHPSVVAYTLLGFFLGAASHTIADVVVTAFKRRF